MPLDRGKSNTQSVHVHYCSCGAFDDGHSGHSAFKAAFVPIDRSPEAPPLTGVGEWVLARGGQGTGVVGSKRLVF